MRFGCVRAALSAVGLLLSIGVAAAADCNTELKPTDGYKELSEKLKCLNSEIQALKKRGSGEAQTIAAAPADRGTITQLPNGCLNAMPGDKGNIVLRFRPPERPKMRDLCWSDGATFMQIYDLEETKVAVQFPGLEDQWRNHNTWHRFDGLDDVIVSFRTVKILGGEGEKPQMKLELQISPKSK